MTWIKLDDTLPNNPKILPLSDTAFRVYIESLCYSNQYLTDGFLTLAVVKKLDFQGICSELFEAGLWDEVENGVQIHDYCDHQTSRADILAKKEAERERVRAYRSRTAQNVRESDTENRIQNTDKYTFLDFWSIYPRKVAKQEAERAYAKALKTASAEEIIEGARRYANDPNRTAQFTAYPATWLNRGSWSDEPIPSKQLEDRFRSVINTPTIVPPRFNASEAPKGVPAPDFIKDLKSSLR
jgi:hypothetical protein